MNSGNSKNQGLYPWKRPRQGDYVKCEIIGVNMQRGIIEVQLLEYGNLCGYAIFKQMRRGRFRNKSALGKVKQKFVGQVLSVGTGLQSVEVSKIAVTPEKEEEVNHQFISLTRLSGFISKISKEYGLDPTTLNDLTFYPRFLEFYEQVYGKKYNPDDEEEFTNDSFDDMGLYVKEDDDDDSVSDNSEDEDDNVSDDSEDEHDEGSDTVLKKIAEYAERLFKGELDINEEFKALQTVGEKEEFYDKFTRRMKNLIRNSTFHLTWDIELISYDDNGVTLVEEYLTRLSSELKKSSVISKKCKSTTLQIVTPPHYQVTMTTKEDSEAIDEVGKILNEIGSTTPNVNIQVKPVVSKELK